MVATFAKFWPGGQKLRLMNESFLVSGPTFRHSKVTCQNPEIAQKSSFFFPVFYMFLNKFLSTYHLNIIKIWPNIIQIPSKISIFGPILRFWQVTFEWRKMNLYNDHFWNGFWSLDSVRIVDFRDVRKQSITFCACFLGKRFKMLKIHEIRFPAKKSHVVPPFRGGGGTQLL